MAFCLSVGWSTTLVQTEIFKQLLDWIAVKFCTDIHGPQRMNPTDYVDGKTVAPVPPASQSFHLSCKISSYLIYWIILYIDGFQRMNPTNSYDGLLFPLSAPWGSHLWFWVKCLNNYWMDCHEIWYTRWSSPSKWIVISLVILLTFHVAPPSADISI